jgi:Sushi repeat (SCR repeat)
VYECKNSSQLRGNGNVTCDLSTGQWDPLPECICPLPDKPPFLKIKRFNDTTITLSCNKSLKLIGSSVSTCDESTDQWSPLPYCTCPLSSLDHVRISPINETSSSYTCDQSLGLTGQGVLTCDRQSANWSSPSCKCEAPTIDNGDVQIEDETEFHFTCHVGFDLVGPSNVTCPPTKGIRTALPTCWRKSSGQVLVYAVASVSAALLLAVITLCAWKMQM